MLFTRALALVVGAMPQLAMSPFTTDSRVLSEGRALRTTTGHQLSAEHADHDLLGGALRSTGEVKLPMYASTSAVVINLVLNYLLIFGHMGCPKLGLMGAAIATCIFPVYRIRHHIRSRLLAAPCGGCEAVGRFVRYGAGLARPFLCDLAADRDD